MSGNVEILPFLPEHIEQMELRPHEMQCSMTLPDIKSRIEAEASYCTGAGTFVYQGKIIFCAGFQLIWEGVAEGWMFSTIYLPSMAVYTIRSMRQYILQTAKTFNLHRFQATSPSDEFHTRWMQALGFEKEGTMRQFTHTKQDYDMFARVF